MRGADLGRNEASAARRGVRSSRRLALVAGLSLAAVLLAGFAPTAAAGPQQGVGLAVSTAGLHSTGQSTSGLRVIPFPGTPDAPATTSIIFSSLKPSDIARVRVTGSASGSHTGHLSALPDGAGTAFVPSTRFAAGETVTVRATLTSARAGAASGAPGATMLRFSFAVAVPEGGPPASGAPAAQPASDRSGKGPAVYMHFRSQVHFEPAAIQASADPDKTSGDIFITARHTHTHSQFQGGPMILDSRGRLVWFKYVNGQTTNLEVQRYQSNPVLTWWQGGSRGAGEDVILDSSYRRVAFVHAGNGYYADSHEFQITPQGTALLDAVVGVRTNLKSVGGPAHGTVQDCVIQEIDIKTGKVLWQWNALGHIPVSASYAHYSGSPYDYLHLNSIQQLPDGNILISARHTWAIYEIDKHTGKIIWTLGGKHSGFKIGAGAKFSWQHDAHLTGDTLSLFDDASNGAQQEESESSAKVLRLNFSARTASLVRRYDHYPPLVASSQGSAEILAGGNMFVGWGDQPDFSEYRPGGHQIFNGTLPVGAQSYRAYRFQWKGEPQTKPSLALSPAPDGSVKVYASWNGATQVTSWKVLGGSRPGSLAPLGGHGRTGFETEVTVHSQPAYLAVEALGSGGTVLATSPAHPDPAHLDIFTATSFVRASQGTGAMAVGCFARQSCHVTLRISSGSHVLASGAHPVARGTGALLYFKLSATGVGDLAHGSSHRLPVTVTVHDSTSNTGATRNVTLISYAVAGPSPGNSSSQSPTIQLLQRPGFVSSSSGMGQILAACYGSAPCQVTGTVSANGLQIAQVASQQLGIDELGSVYFKLSPAGRTMLSHASGNQLPVQVSITDGADTATGNLALVGYR